MVALTVFAGLSISLQAQDAVKPERPRFFAYWGWNRDVYSASDIHFQGDGYNFTLSHVAAHDKPIPLAFDPYFHPTKVTIPQTNARIGLMVKPNLSLSLTLDHMKYVMEQDEDVKTRGVIHLGTPYDGSHRGDFVHTNKDFLKFEHTDGLNYISTELRHYSPLLSLHRGKFLHLDIDATQGFGAGFLLPKTNCTLLGKPRHDDFHLSGWGSHVLSGLQFRFWKYFLIEPELKGGFINLPDIRTTSDPTDRADQHFWYGSFDVLVGGAFDIGRKRVD